MAEISREKGGGGLAALLTASLVWAFSFGLIKHKLVDAGMDSFFVAFVRLALSFIAFVPFLRCGDLPRRLMLRLALVGAVQYGIMYVTYLAAYRYLAGYQVALFTVLTPIYVTLLADALGRRFHARALFAAAVAAVGGAVVVAGGCDIRRGLVGFGLMQISNISFAAGQVAYRRIDIGVGDARVFALLYLGGAVVAAAAAAIFGRCPAEFPAAGQMLTLLYLGLVPSALCFFLWNAGARCVQPGLLAVLNNAKIPLAVVCSLVFFGEKAGLPSLLAGGGLLLAASMLVREGSTASR